MNYAHGNPFVFITVLYGSYPYFDITFRCL